MGSRFFNLFILFTTLFSLQLVGSFSQVKTSSGTPELNGDGYILHEVNKGQTLFAISQAYDVKQSELIRINPSLKEGLKVDDVLKIPQKKDNKKRARRRKKKKGKDYILPTDTHYYHRVKRRETIYSIAKEYNVTPEDIYRENPNSRKKIKTGQVLQIPRKKREPKAKDISVTPPAIVLEEDENYQYHKVEKGETLYSLSKKYECEIATLIKENPSIKKSLSTGKIIRIPKKRDKEYASLPPDNFFLYRVMSGDTYFRLKRRYGVHKDELKDLNPQLIEGLKTGMVINIPKKRVISSQSHIPPGCLSGPSEIQGSHFDVALFLPLYLEANDSINIIGPASNKARKEIYQNSVNFIHFYEGLLLALQELKYKGIGIRLHVFDTNLDPSEVAKQVYTSEFLSFDLIIGPIYGRCQRLVSELSAKNRIPMVSPLSMDKSMVMHNPYYFQINPDKEYKLNTVSQFIGDDYFNKNFIVMNMGDNGHLDESGVVDKVRERFFSTGFYGDADDVLFHEFNFNKDGYYGLKRIMDPYSENVVIVPVKNEADISRAITNLNTASKKFDVTYFAVNYVAKNYTSIETEYLHNLNMHYLAPYYVDYGKENVIKFIKQYRKEFKTEPNQYSFQGYDIAWYFLNAMGKFGKNFIDCLPYFNVDLLQSDYNFQKVSDFGGYMNQTLYIIEYTKDYEVKATGKVWDQPVIYETEDRSPEFRRFWDGIDPRKRMVR